jgi:hypothetical protein
VAAEINSINHNYRYEEALRSEIDFSLQDTNNLESISKNCVALAGLPDGIFSNRKCKFGKILEGLGVEKVGIF